MRQDVYRVAYDEAHEELLEISKRFEELRRRKETLQSVVTALGPMLGVVPAVQAASSSPAANELVTPAPQATAEPANHSFNEAHASLPEGDDAITDPFQRRVRNALKFGSSNNGHEQRGLQPAV
jgi:hypothetical protein